MKAVSNERFVKKFIAYGVFLGGFALLSFSTPTLNASIVNTSTSTPYNNLQTAIDSASPGDTITISGTQFGNFVINKDLTLKGGKNAVLDGNFTGTVLTIGTVSNVVVYLDHLTIQNGIASEGGGIFNEATTYLSHVSVINNGATNSGGGIYNESTIAHLFIENSEVEHNGAENNGGGIFNDLGGLTITHSKISYNTTNDGDGGGVYNNSGISIVAISNTKFKHNSAEGDGGGFYSSANETSFSHVKFKWNRATNGGGLYNTDDSTLDIEHSHFKRNTASNNGAGVYNEEGILNFSRSEIKHNTASETGGGIFNVGLDNLHLFKTKVKHNNPNNIVTGLLA